MSDRQKVQSWLTAHGIRYEYSRDITDEEQQKVASAAGLQGVNLNGAVVGRIDGKEAFPGGYIMVSFFFNHDDRCIGHDVSAFYFDL